MPKSKASQLRGRVRPDCSLYVFLFPRHGVQGNTVAHNVPSDIEENVGNARAIMQETSREELMASRMILNFSTRYELATLLGAYKTRRV